MENQDITILPSLYDHGVVANSRRCIFNVDPEFMILFGRDIGAHWVCFCPDGEMVRLVFCPSGITTSSVGGDGWTEIKFRFGLGHGRKVHFHYLGGQRFPG
ncbi:hypothetical protein RIF29_10194 [Crotalaria pallida]|uniref:Uncharacterized protein n=1 Tax=Crotalaria pallida TaxID=3830 RepID=A0AAN9FSM9_CROPI